MVILRYVRDHMGHILRNGKDLGTCSFACESQDYWCVCVETLLTLKDCNRKVRNKHWFVPGVAYLQCMARRYSQHARMPATPPVLCLEEQKLSWVGSRRKLLQGRALKGETEGGCASCYQSISLGAFWSSPQCGQFLAVTLLCSGWNGRVRLGWAHLNAMASCSMSVSMPFSCWSQVTCIVVAAARGNRFLGCHIPKQERCLNVGEALFW